MFIKIFALICLFINIASAKTNSISKIVITSNKAECKKNEQNNYIFTYYDNVLVKFADNSKINSDKLEIELDTTKNSLVKTTTATKNSTQKNSTLSQFKKITFIDNVFIKKINRTIKTDKAELFLNKKECYLLGNVAIEQTKINPKDLPIKTFCDKAILNLETEKITFLGTTEKPVNTRIVLEDHPGLLKKIKTKEEKKAERKRLRKLKTQQRLTKQS